MPLRSLSLALDLKWNCFYEFRANGKCLTANDWWLENSPKTSLQFFESQERRRLGVMWRWISCKLHNQTINQLPEACWALQSATPGHWKRSQLQKVTRTGMTSHLLDVIAQKSRFHLNSTCVSSLERRVRFQSIGVSSWKAKRAQSHCTSHDKQLWLFNLTEDKTWSLKPSQPDRLAQSSLNFAFNQTVSTSLTLPPLPPLASIF